MDLRVGKGMAQQAHLALGEDALPDSADTIVATACSCSLVRAHILPSRRYDKRRQAENLVVV